MTFAIAIEGAVANSPNNICPKPLKQTLVPWLTNYIQIDSPYLRGEI